MAANTPSVSAWLNSDGETVGQVFDRGGRWSATARLWVLSLVLFLAFADSVGIYTAGIPAIGGLHNLATSSAPHNPVVTPKASVQKSTDVPANTPAYIASLLPAARQIHKDIGWPVSVLLAQWIQEHGYPPNGGMPDWSGYNLGNVKDDLHCETTDTGFCHDATLEAGITDYEIVAGLSYYTSVLPAYKSGNAITCAVALGESPWDEAHYTTTDQPGSLLIGVMGTYDLTRYD